MRLIALPDYFRGQRCGGGNVLCGHGKAGFGVAGDHGFISLGKLLRLHRIGYRASVFELRKIHKVIGPLVGIGQACPAGNLAASIQNHFDAVGLQAVLVAFVVPPSCHLDRSLLRDILVHYTVFRPGGDIAVDAVLGHVVDDLHAVLVFRNPCKGHIPLIAGTGHVFRGGSNFLSVSPQMHPHRLRTKAVLVASVVPADGKVDVCGMRSKGIDDLPVPVLFLHFIDIVSGTGRDAAVRIFRFYIYLGNRVFIPCPLLCFPGSAFLCRTPDGQIFKFPVPARIGQRHRASHFLAVLPQLHAGLRRAKLVRISVVDPLLPHGNVDGFLFDPGIGNDKIRLLDILGIGDIIPFQRILAHGIIHRLSADHAGHILEEQRPGVSGECGFQSSSDHIVQAVRRQAHGDGRRAHIHMALVFPDDLDRHIFRGMLRVDDADRIICNKFDAFRVPFRQPALHDPHGIRVIAGNIQLKHPALVVVGCHRVYAGYRIAFQIMNSQRDGGWLIFVCIFRVIPDNIAGKLRPRHHKGIADTEFISAAVVGNGVIRNRILHHGVADFLSVPVDRLVLEGEFPVAGSADQHIQRLLSVRQQVDGDILLLSAVLVVLVHPVNLTGKVHR